MPHIAILIHEQDRLNEPNYVLNEMAEIWREQGLHVSVLQGVKHYTEADLLILHVDLTVVP